MSNTDLTLVYREMGVSAIHAGGDFWERHGRQPTDAEYRAASLRAWDKPELTLIRPTSRAFCCAREYRNWLHNRSGIQKYITNNYHCCVLQQAHYPFIRHPYVIQPTMWICPECRN